MSLVTVACLEGMGAFLHIDHKLMEMDSALARDIRGQCVIEQVHQHALTCADVTI